MDIEMSKGQHKKGGKYTTPNQKVPMMVLEDGTQLGESVAICRCDTSAPGARYVVICGYMI